MIERLTRFMQAWVEQEVSRRHPAQYESTLDHSELLGELLKAVKVAKSGDEKKEAGERFQESIALRKAEAFAKYAGPPIEVTIDNEATFRTILTELDADYLYSHLDDESRSKLEGLAAGWSDQWANLIVREFWPGGKANEVRLTRIFPESVQARISSGEAEDIAQAALAQFCTGQRRVIRWAIETAQRDVLAGRKPRFAVAVTEHEMLRSWRSYLGRYSRRQLESGKERPGQIEEHDLAEDCLDPREDDPYENDDY